MKNKELCKKCKYHGTMGNRGKREADICCDYATLAQDGTCLKYMHGEIIDRRGNDYDKCLLFKKGEGLGRHTVNAFNGKIGG